MTISVGTDTNSLTLQWQGVAGATAYRVYCDTAPGATSHQHEIPQPLGIATSAEIRFLRVGTTYYCVVTTLTASGESAASAEVHETVAGVGIDIRSPLRRAVVGSQVSVQVLLRSRYEIATVTAEASGRQIVLVPTPGFFPNPGDWPHPLPGWLGTLVLTGAPRGPITLTITATDTYGSVTQKSEALRYDLPPRITVTAPDSFTVARPGLRVAATCQDDETSCTIRVVTNQSSSPLASATGQLDQTVSGTGIPGTVTTLIFQAVDSTGQVTAVSRRVFVEPSSQLAEVAVANGVILDAEADRLLYVNQSSGRNVLTIRDRVSGAEVVIFDAPPGDADASTSSTPILRGFLTPVGATFLFDSTRNALVHDATHNVVYSPSSTVNSWENGSLQSFSGQELRVNGRFATWNDGLRTTVTRRDFVAGQNLVIPAGPQLEAFGVGPNGDVVYSAGVPGQQFQIFRSRGGIVTQLTNDTASNIWPSTDGARVVYSKFSGATSSSQFAVYDSTGEHTGPLGTIQAAVTDGWIAYHMMSPTGVNQVWVRSPGGVDTQASRFATGGTWQVLGPAGQVVFYNGSRRYLATPDYDAMPRDIGTMLGRVVFRDGRPFVILGRSLFQVLP